MGWLSSDSRKGTLFFLISIILTAVIYFLTKKTISVLYLIPGLFLIIANIYWFTKPDDRRIFFHKR